MPDVTLDLGNQYIGSAYSPQVAITETETGHEIEFTFADSENPGQTKTEGFEVPNYSDEEAAREAAEAQRQAYEAQRIAAEDARAAAESSRVSAENERRGYEQGRQYAETARQQAEAARAAAESARAGAESNRQSSEQARKDAENARQFAEHDRRAAEELRAEAESARESAEQAREAAEQARETNTAAAIAGAQAATSAANTAAATANSAATAAETATGEAETATDAANAAAALATAAAEGITDAYFPNLTAGAAEGIIGGGSTDTAAWTYRECLGTDGPATIESIHGRTLVWNQAFLDFDDTWGVRNVTTSYDQSTNTVTVTSNTDENTVKRTSKHSDAGISGHKYYIASTIDTSNLNLPDASIGFNYDGTNVGSLYIPDGTVGRISGIITATGNSNYVVLRIPSGTPTGRYITFRDSIIIDLTLMFGAGNEPSTVAEFEALYPEPYYPYDAGSPLSVQMEGIETVGFNQWDEEWEVGGFNNETGQKNSSTTVCRSKNYIHVFPNTTYYYNKRIAFYYYDADKNYVGRRTYIDPTTITTGPNVHYVMFMFDGTTMPSGLCINLSWSGYRNGEYEPYWKSERTIPAATYFPNGMRSAGTVYDELTSDAAVTRVGVVDLGTLEWQWRADTRLDTGGYFQSETLNDAKNGSVNKECAEYTVIRDQVGLTNIISVYGSSVDNVTFSTATSLAVFVIDSAYTNASTFKTAISGVMFYYELATPTTTPIDPPLNLTYRAEQGGTEAVMVPAGEQSAPPTLVITYGSTADGIRDRALACIAPIEGSTASANYGVGSYLIHGGQLCKVTTAIATGEAITIGTNVTATTVMAELLALTQ